MLLAVGLLAALVLLGLVIGACWVEGIDAAVSNRFGDHRSHHTTVVTDAIFKFIGDPAGVAICAAVFGGLLSLQARSVIPIVLVMGAVATAVAVEHTLKALLGRTIRPDAPAHWSVITDYVHSYPSGHVAGSAALLGTIAVISSVGRAQSTKVTLTVLVMLCVLSVAVMALYVHAHLVSDVIGGMLLGGAVVTTSAVVATGRAIGRGHPISR